MKTRQLWTLLIILAVLAAGVTLKQFHRPAELAVEEYSSLDISFDPASVRKITIEKIVEGQAAPDPALKAEIVKEGGKWILPGVSDARADEKKVEEFLKELRGVKGELRGSSKDIFSDFGIADSGSFHITLEPSVELIMGSKRSGSGVFLRKKGSDSVYLVNTGLWSYAGIFGESDGPKPSLSFWAARDFLRVDSSKVRSVEIIKPGKTAPQTLLVYEAGAKWKYSRPGIPFAVDSDKVSQFLYSMGEWTAEKVLDSAARDYGFSKPSFEMKLTFDGGVQKTWSAGAEDGETQSVYFKVSGEPSVFLLSKAYFESLDRDDGSFAADNPLGVDPLKVEKLTVRARQVEKTVNPLEKKWDAMSAYLQDIRKLQITRFLQEPSEQKAAGGPYSIEVTVQGAQPVTLRAGDVIPGEKKEHPAVLEGSKAFFAVSEADFKKLFENLERLDEPQISMKKS